MFLGYFWNLPFCFFFTGFFLSIKELFTYFYLFQSVLEFLKVRGVDYMSIFIPILY